MFLYQCIHRELKSQEKCVSISTIHRVKHLIGLAHRTSAIYPKQCPLRMTLSMSALAIIRSHTNYKKG